MATKGNEAIVELLLFIWMHMGDEGLHMAQERLIDLGMGAGEDEWVEFHKRRDTYREYLQGEKDRLSKVMP